MNKSIEIKHFSLIDYNILLKVVAEYIRQYQISRDKFEYEKGMFGLTDTLYALQCHKNAVDIEIENHWKSFWVKVKETKTKYKFEIRYASQHYKANLPRLIDCSNVYGDDYYSKDDLQDVDKQIEEVEKQIADQFNQNE